MKHSPSRRLAVARETVRNLSTIQLGGVAAGQLRGPPVNTTHSIITVCTQPSTSIQPSTGSIFGTGTSG